MSIRVLVESKGDHISSPTSKMNKIRSGFAGAGAITPGHFIEMELFINNHKTQLDAMCLPEHLHEQVANKLLNSIFDVGEFCCFESNEDASGIAYDLLAQQNMTENGVVFLVDHMWTTTFPQSRNHLQEHPELLDRIAISMGQTGDIAVDRIWSKVWPHLGCYVLPSDEYTKWYLMDEVGLAIQHSSDPNVKCCPLWVNMNGQQYSISVMWPIKSIATGDCLTRNYLPQIAQGPERTLRMLGFDQNENVFCAETLTDLADFNTIVAPTVQEPTSLNAWPTISKTWNTALDNVNSVSQSKRPLKIFCDRPAHVNPDLITNPNKIVLVNTAEEADVLYLIDHTYGNNDDMEYCKSEKMVNQFWWDGMVTSKEHLARVIRRAHRLHLTAAAGAGAAVDSTLMPEWAAKSYDLSELDDMLAFVREFQPADKCDTAATEHVDNTWILKRYRGKQSVDYPITCNLSCALRHLESAPRLACKYINNPALLSNKKFDLRFYVMVHSLEPLVLRRHELFVIRWANLDYSPGDFESYQKHFTVMNLLDDETIGEIRGGGSRNDITRDDFIALFDREHSADNVTWQARVQVQIDSVIRQVFQSVKDTTHLEEIHPCGFPLHPNAGWSLNQPNACPAKAMYGIDIILTQELQPVVLEVQWAPDCDKAVHMLPCFWDEILAALYLNEMDHVVEI